MPLKLSRRAGTTAWWITGTIDGRRYRESTGRTEKAEAAEASVILACRPSAVAAFTSARMAGSPAAAKRFISDERCRGMPISGRVAAKVSAARSPSFGR